MPRNVRRAQLSVKVVLAVITLCASIFGVISWVSPATAEAATMQADEMATSGVVSTVIDPGASGGRALKLATTGSSVSYSATTSALSGLVIRARGVNCLGWPTLQVIVDSVVRATVTVGTAMWTDFSVTMNVPAGMHTFTVRYTNDFALLLCDRSVDLDTVTDVSATPTTTSSTTTTTPSTTTTSPPTTTTTPSSTSTTTPPTTSCATNSYRARYFNNTTLSGAPVYEACEWAVGGNFASGSPAPGVNADRFSIEYVGALNFPTSGSYTFAADTGDMGVLVALDGATVINNSAADTWGRFEQVRSVSAGTHTVRVTMSDTAGTAIENFSVSRAGVGPATGDGRYFAATSFWNTQITAPQVSANSAAWIGALVANSAITQISLNQNAWSTPVYQAPAGTPRRAIRVTNSNKSVTVPYLSSYAPSPDADSHLAIVDQSTGCLYEFQSFSASRGTAIAHASYHAYTGSGGHTSGPAHAGGEFSYVAGMITPADVRAGVIAHALRVAIPRTSGRFVYPGTRSDGTDSSGMPQGSRLRLNPSLNIDALGLTPFQKMVAVALRDYGAYIADTSDAFSIYAQSTIDGSTYSQPLSNLPKSLIGQLQVLDSRVSSTDIQLDSASDTTCAQQG